MVGWIALSLSRKKIMMHMLFDSSNVPEMNTFQNYQLKHTEDTFTQDYTGQKVQL